MTNPDPDAARDAIEYCYEKGWTDGLPVVPATEALVEQFLAQTTRAPDEVLWRMDHLDRECTVHSRRSTPSWPAVCRSTSPSFWPPGTR